MITLICFLLALLTAPFKSKSRLEAENAALRHQLAVLRRKVRGRIELANGDRLFLIQLYRWFPSVLHAITIIQPETLVRWHRAGFRRYWRWKSRCLGGRPQIEGVSLPKIISSHSDGVGRTGLAWRRLIRIAGQVGVGACPYAIRDACALRCSKSRRWQEHAANGLRQRSGRDPDSRAAASRSGAPHTRSARATSAMLGDPEFPSREGEP